MNDLVTLPILALAVEVLAGSALAVQLAVRFRTVINVPSGLLLMYVIVIPLSGIVHLINLPGATRGFFDVLSQGRNAPTELLGAVLLSWLGLAALWIGAMLVKPAPSEILAGTEFVEPFRVSTWIVVGLVLLVPTTLALAQASALRTSIDSTRVWGFADGNARIAFLAGWVPWAVGFLAVALSRFFRAPLAQLIVLALSSYFIYQAATWGGGRSLALVYVFPILVIIFPRLGRLRPIAIIALIGATIYALVIGTIDRTATFRVQGVNLPGIVDWEWGRFSMVAYAVNRAHEEGYLFGLTYVQALLEVPLSILKLAGLDLGINLPSISEVTAADILGDATQNYTVPGALAESYMNGGVMLTGIVFLLLGVLAAGLDRAARQPGGTARKLLIYYLISLLILRGLVAESVSIPTYVAFTGLPLLVFALVERGATRRAAKLRPQGYILT